MSVRCSRVLGAMMLVVSMYGAGSNAAGAGRFVIVPTIEGRPVDALAGTPATASIRGPDKPPAVTRHVVAGDGTVEVSEVPEGAFRLRMVIDLDPGAGYGDCSTPEELVPASGRTSRHEMPLTCAIRLIVPDPTSEGHDAAPFEEAVPTLPASPAFSWTPVPGARRYRYELETRSQWDSGLREVVAGDVSETTWSSTVAPSMPGSTYWFTVSAYGETEKIGSLSVRVPSGRGTRILPAYGFRVAGADIEPGRGRIVLVPTYDGQPLDPVLDVPVDLHLTRAEAGTGEDRPARLVGGAVDVGEIETGVYAASMRLVPEGVIGERWRRGISTPHPSYVFLLRDGGQARAEIALHQPIMTTDVGTEPLPSPVTIEWEAVEGARSYDIRVVAIGPAEPVETLFEHLETVTDARWQRALPSSRPGSTYWLSLTARTERAPIASTSLRFAVR